MSFRPTSAAGSISTTSSLPPSKPPQQAKPLTASNISLFLSNVRLLDLDKRADWPDVTVRTFDTKHVSHNQKRRIACVEWILFRLFQILDPELTRDKLQPFFPPLEPLQSINLRAALFRAFNDLKKNGILGREILLRKTMLDECKGERFEETLLSFSTLVLRKKLQSERNYLSPSIAQTLGIVDSLKPSDLRNLHPLALAHRISLNVKLQRRAKDKALFDSFHDAVLHEHRRTRRHLEDTVAAQSQISDDLAPKVANIMQNEVQRNWAGPIEGSQLLLGTSVPDTSTMPSFADALEKFRQTGDLPSDRKEQDLLETLEAGLEEQTRRLAEWNEYATLMKNTVGDLNDTRGEGLPSSAGGTNIMFAGHQGIRLDQVSRENLVSLSGDTDSGYGAVVTEMIRDISKVAERRSRKQQGQTIAPVASHKSISSFSSTTPRGVQAKRVPLLRATSQQLKNDLFSPLKNASYLPDSPIVVEDMMPEETFETRSSPILSKQPLSAALFGQHASNGVELRELPVVPLKPVTHDYSTMGETHEEFQQHGTGEHQSDATNDHILETDNVHTPDTAHSSLAERARMSMALSSADDAGFLPSKPSFRPDTDQLVQISSDPPKVNRRVSLADRTRQAMNLAQSDIKRRQSKREKPQAYYPVNQFETPVKSKQAPVLLEGDIYSDISHGKETTPKEKLFSEDAEYASVFKSRPKIVASPLPSPVAEDLTSFIHDEEEFGSSPLKVFGGDVSWGR